MMSGFNPRTMTYTDPGERLRRKRLVEVQRLLSPKPRTLTPAELQEQRDRQRVSAGRIAAEGPTTGGSIAGPGAFAAGRPNPSTGMTMEDMVATFAGLAGGGGGGFGGGGGGGAALMDIGQIRDRYSKARSDLEARYGRSIEELDELHGIAERRNERAAGDRRAAHDDFARVVNERQANHVAHLAALQAQADQARAAHGIDPSAGSIAATERLNRNAETMSSAEQAQLASESRMIDSDAAHEAEVRALLDKSGRASALESRTDAETALELAEQQAIQEAEMFNAQAAAAAAGGGGGGSGGFGGGAGDMAAILSALADENDAWQYPLRQDAMERAMALGLPPEDVGLLLNPEADYDSAMLNMPLMLRMFAERQARRNAARGPKKGNSLLEMFNMLPQYALDSNPNVIYRNTRQKLEPILRDFYQRGNTLNPAAAQRILLDMVGG